MRTSPKALGGGCPLFSWQQNFVFAAYQKNVKKYVTHVASCVTAVLLFVHGRLYIITIYLYESKLIMRTLPGL